MSKGTYQRTHLTLSGLCLAAMSTFAPLALAQIIIPTPATQSCGSTAPGGTPICTEVSATPGLSCGYARGGTGCTANDFVGNAQVTSNTITACHIGDTITGQSLAFQITSNNAVRYAPGVFIGEQNQPLNAAGGTCSVATFPTTNTGTLADPTARTPFPWFAAGAGNVCGSYSSSFTSMEQIDNVTMKCSPDASGALAITFMVVYAQNAGNAGTCTGPANVAPGTSSKCSTGGTPVTNVVVTYNANPTCSIASFVYDPVAGTVTAKATITNNGPDAAGPALGGDVTFTDNVPGPAVVTSATCGNPQGGAVCGTTGFAGNNVSGTITTFPAGSSVDVTISGTVPPGSHVMLNDTFTLAVNGTVVTVPAQWQNTCVSAVQLPVKLQNFDVK